MATDLDAESFQIAAEGIYSESSFGEMPPDLHDRYFQALGGGRYKVLPDLRRALIFSEHNLLKDPPSPSCTSSVAAIS
jgi:chemotaxis protein methyltransferase CheR